MDCSNQMRDKVATEPQEEESIDEGLLDRASNEEVEEQEEEVDRAPKRMHQSEDGDVQKLNAQIAKVKVVDVVPCDTVLLSPVHGNTINVDWNPNDPASGFIMALMGVDNIVREGPDVDSRRALPMTIAGSLDPY